MSGDVPKEREFEIVVRSVVEEKYRYTALNQQEATLAFNKKIASGEVQLKGCVQAIVVKSAFDVKDIPLDYSVEILPERAGETCGDDYVVTHNKTGYTYQDTDLKKAYSKVAQEVSRGPHSTVVREG